MSLGLEDLKKKTASKAKAPTAAEERKLMKPWSHSGLSKTGSSRKQEVGVNFHINEDWIEIQGESIFWFDLNFEFGQAHDKSNLMIHARLTQIENKILGSFEKVKNLFHFFGLSKTTS